MLKEKVFELVRLCLGQQYNGYIFEFDETTNLVDGALLDSLDLVEWIIEIEKNFDIKIPEELEDAETLGEILDYMETIENITIPEKVHLYVLKA